MNAQEANGEQREKNGGKFAETDDFGRAVLKRKPPETAPTLGERAKKSQPDKGWDFTLWWSWRELNPRPQAFFGQIYMFSALFSFLHLTSRRHTLRKMPAPLNLVPRQGARHATS